MAGDHHEPRSATNTPLVNPMTRSALPIQRKAVPHQDSNEIAKLHTL
jgi:hypothetical protein